MESIRAILGIVAVATMFLFATTPVSAEETNASGFDWFAPFSKLSGEYEADETYVGEAAVKRSKTTISDFDEHDIILHFVLTPRIKLGVLRLGLEWENF